MAINRVGTRLALAFGVVLALMAGAVTVAFVGIRNGAEQATRLESENLQLLNAADAMRVAQLDEAVAIRDFVSNADVSAQRKARSALAQSDKSYTAAAASLDRFSANEGMERVRDLAAQLRKGQAAVGAKIRDAIDLADNAEYQRAQDLVYREAGPLQSAIAAQLKELAALTNDMAQQRGKAARGAARDAELQLGVVLAVALLIGVIATLRITRGIVVPLRTAVGLAERVASGDLTGAAKAASRDETGRVVQALCEMQASLHRLVQGIRMSSERVSQASEQIADGNADLAQRTEEQATSLEETAASVEELTSTVRQNTENAARASTLARKASTLAEDGGRVVGSVVDTMGGIHASSRQVAEIMGIIEGIAFQTNLLALNAAVEAARAGEHGRGFSVVAAEVRDLAKRCADAAKQIRDLVGDAVGRADAGARLAQQAGDAMTDIVRVVKDVSNLVGEIASASEEQRAGIEQVNTTISQMETVTQRNASLVEKIHAMTDALLHESRALGEASGRFQLAEAETPAPAADAGPAANVPIAAPRAGLQALPVRRASAAG